MVQTKKKVAMPFGIRQKMMAAVAMLLVASLLMVTSTYAWFTLSTAPEVTGITTSVGANGNLEIALLTTDTYATPANITSAVGDSYVTAGKNATTANITWGNLVDLSDDSYGLTSVKLLPAQANVAEGALAVASPLKTPTYGPDGRVDIVDANTVSAIKNGSTNAFTYDSTAQTYGVRAVGVANNISPRQITFNGAKSAVSGAISTAARQLKTPVAAGQTTLLAVAISGSAPESYTAKQVSDLLNMVKGAQSALNTIVRAYANAGVAVAAANTTITDEKLNVLTAAVTNNAASLKTALNTAGVNNYDTELGELASAQQTVEGAITTLNSYAENGAAAGEETAAVNNAVAALYTTKTFYKNVENSDPVITEDASELMSAGGTAYISGGTFSTVAKYIGNQNLLTLMDVTAVAGAADNTATPALTTLVTNVNGLTPPAGTATSTISDTYGYIIDFAFRTNAADSKLQLQTEAINRVYSGETGETLATQGSGSNVTFTFTEDLSAAQANTLLNNVKLVFFNPADGTVFANAKLTEVTAAGGTATANIKLVVAEGADADDIVALNQNEIKFVSVLVYLDGETITNADVANAAASGTLDLNLQFSSSATLVPMENTALRTMTAE
ncbi:MAG: hypothetical protein II881_01290 [Oscillospiraceae bacterium]|nr:hypothetical protein [Oscillospiraceae bacterium]